MKKLLLLSALLIFACSSDDSNDDPTNQLFLDIFDGVVWQSGSPDAVDSLTFSSDPSSITFYDFGSCDTIIFGETYPFTGTAADAITYTIQSESESRLVLTLQLDVNEGDLTYNSNRIFTVSSGGNTLLEEFAPDSDQISQQQPNTYIIAPDEFPCN
jgi:hypothetical protein